MHLVKNTWIPEDQYFSEIFSRVDVFDLKSLRGGLRFVSRFNLCIDGGAHVGSWSRYLSFLFKVVLAFEPEPENYECLIRNVPENVGIYNSALGPKMGFASLLPGINSGCFHIHEGSSTKVVTIDSFNLESLDYLKLDVEGFEWAALKGGEESIKRFKPVVQIEEKKLRHYYKSPQTAREFLEELGYKEVLKINNDVVFVWG